jgi:hypothetical protein
MALELLKHGLAVTARGSIAGTDLSNSYLAAEQAAQGQKIGLWSVTTTASAAPVAAAAPTAPVLLPPHIEATALPAEADSKKDDKVTPRTDKALAPDTQTQAKIVADVLSQQAQARLDESVSASGEEAGFFERYQILIAGFLMLATGFSITGALWAQKRRDRSDEIKSIAAALRGEMMAARSVCLGRAKTINDEAEDRAATWPRIRATLYQAYVGRLGILGAELARQIASLYGQMSDYAALNGANGLAQEAPKKHALETLARHIDEVLPRLADIERTGNIPASYRMVSVRPAPRYMPPSAPVSASPAVEEQPEPAPVYAVDEEAPAAIGSEVRAPRATPALWQAVREFIQSRRGALSTTPQEVDPNVAEYAAIIEADMARYKQGSRTENYDLYPKKKKI